MGKRGSEHTRVQRQGRKRDLGICQLCGGAHQPEGHHMFDYQYGGAASVNNIVTLCHQCHRTVHNGEVDLFRF